MNRYLILLIVFSCVRGYAQEPLSRYQIKDSQYWDSVIFKANRESKIIMVDCFATWCIPCKKMENEVLSDEGVKRVLDSNFLVVRLQIDTTETDNHQIRRLRGLSSQFEMKYGVREFPTFLFFDNTGALIHKAIGFKTIRDFLAKLHEVNGLSDFSERLKRYEQNNIDSSELLELALQAKNVGRFEKALEIAGVYSRYLDNKAEDFLLQKQNLIFYQNFPTVIRSTDHFFSILRSRESAVDAVLKFKGFSDRLVCTVIRQEEVSMAQNQSLKADYQDLWRTIASRIKYKYGEEYISKVVFPAHVEFLKHKKDWVLYAELIDSLIKIIPPTVDGTSFMRAVGGFINDAWALNGLAWDAAERGDHTSVIEKALTWSELSLKLSKVSDPYNFQFMDTKAHLFFKLGKFDLAVHTEKLAMRFDSLSAIKAGRKGPSFYDEMSATLKDFEAAATNIPRTVQTVINKDIVEAWVSLHSSKIGSFGNFIAYAAGSSLGGDSLFLWSKNTGKTVNLGYVKSYEFTKDEKYLLFDSKSQLVIFNLHDNSFKSIERVDNYKIVGGEHQVLMVKSGLNVSIYDLSGTILVNVENSGRIWYDNGTGNMLIGYTIDYKNFVGLYNFENRSFTPLTSGSNITAIFNSKNDRVAIQKTVADSIYIEVFEVKYGKKISNFSYNATIPITIQKFLFSDSVILIKKVITLHFPKITPTLPLIWSSGDSKLLSTLRGDSTFAIFSALNMKTWRLLDVNRIDETPIFSTVPDAEYAVIENIRGELNESYWNKKSVRTLSLINLKNGLREVFPHFISRPGSIHFSPDNRFVLCSQLNSQFWYSCDLVLKCWQLITVVSGSGRQPYLENDRNFTFAGWNKDSRSVMFYDDRDIWQFDIFGKGKSINLTNFFGQKRQFRFKFAFQSREFFDLAQKNYLIGIDEYSRKTGFFQISDKTADPLPLNLQNEGLGYKIFDGHRPIKADSANIYVIAKESPRQSPNLFFTSDFLKFHLISSIFPERNVRWLTADLINWKDKNGNALQGILYKPLDFDPTIKYPVIVNFYETSSTEYNDYIKPALSDGLLNVPWFVSRGYLVFKPDIRFTNGRVGSDILNSVCSGVDRLLSFKFVDRKRIGVHGLSFGGYGVNYLITHTDKFTAASSASGTSDMISSYGSFREKRFSNQFVYETGQYRLGKNPWQDRDMYIANSPIFFANKAKTPTLFMSNGLDFSVPSTQGIELFLALRRLNKPAWLLNYQNQGHDLDPGPSLDFTDRITGFFSHFLLSNPAPKWMTNHTNSFPQAIETSIDVGNVGFCFNGCQVCEKWHGRSVSNPPPNY